MVVALASITLSAVVDVDACYRYYLLQSSTLTKPAVPTSVPPGEAWDDTEPTYSSGSTQSLYVVDLTVFSDGSFSYSPVSLSTAYEAAKEAYNKAAAVSSEVTQMSELIVEKEKILMEAIEERVTESDFDSYREQAAAQLEMKANEIAVTISSETEQLESKLSIRDETIAANRDYVERTAAELRQTSTQLIQTSESLSLKVTEIINNGVSELHNEMGYDVDGTGFHVSRAGDEISATLNNHGLTVKHNEEKQLVADETGVDARNLHASTYLIIGAHSRMEDYGDGTGLFFTG